MWGRKSLIEEYLDKYPDSSLREYNEYVKEEERKRHQEKVDSDKGVVLELVDRHGLGPCAARREGSSPSYPTTFIY